MTKSPLYGQSLRDKAKASPFYKVPLAMYWMTKASEGVVFYNYIVLIPYLCYNFDRNIFSLQRWDYMTNRKIRDTVFCHYMATESHLLELFNALNGTDFTDSSNVSINTLEGSFFSNIKNDISFLMDNLMVVLIEHQTTINPNMPLRFLSYVDELYRRYTQSCHDKIYSQELVKIPAPEFFVFYDGENTSFEQQTLKLSNAFTAESNNLELIVHVYNLAEGMNVDFLNRCQSLKEYCIFSNKYKEFRRQGQDIDTAVRAAVHYCLDNDVMKEYLINNQKEVIDMFGFEWNEREEKEALFKAGEERGEARGKAIGETNGTLNAIKNLMNTTNWSAENAMHALGISPSEYKKYLMML